MLPELEEKQVAQAMADARVLLEQANDASVYHDKDINRVGVLLGRLEALHKIKEWSFDQSWAVAGDFEELKALLKKCCM